jgi:2-desacetyl-2-hydroxyethyl bacteriochlorophyllide A dehydrogenase
VKSIILNEPGSFERITCDDPGKPGPGEARIRIEKIGICGTDLHAFRGRQPFFAYPRILGHELGVVVEDVGEGVENVKPGDRCAVEPYLNCGTCVACHVGKMNCCTSLSVLGVHIDGGMREAILVPSTKLHVSNKLQVEQLALVETLGIGAHAVDRTQPKPGEKVLVIGAGPIGLSVLQFAAVSGADIALLELNPDRMAFAKAQFGINTCFSSLDTALEEVVAWTDGDLPTAVFDATGNPASMESAFSYVANGGRLTFVGLVQADITFNDPEFHRREMTLLATRNARSEDLARIITLIESGDVDTKPWITHRAGYDDFVEAFPTWLEPEAGVVKAMLELDREA